MSVSDAVSPPLHQGASVPRWCRSQQLCSEPHSRFARGLPGWGPSGTRRRALDSQQEPQQRWWSVDAHGERNKMHSGNQTFCARSLFQPELCRRRRRSQWYSSSLLISEEFQPSERGFYKNTTQNLSKNDLYSTNLKKWSLSCSVGVAVWKHTPIPKPWRLQVGVSADHLCLSEPCREESNLKQKNTNRKKTTGRELQLSQTSAYLSRCMCCTESRTTRWRWEFCPEGRLLVSPRSSTGSYRCRPRTAEQRAQSWGSRQHAASRQQTQTHLSQEQVQDKDVRESAELPAEQHHADGPNLRATQMKVLIRCSCFTDIREKKGYSTSATRLMTLLLKLTFSSSAISGVGSISGMVNNQADTYMMGADKNVLITIPDVTWRTKTQEFKKHFWDYVFQR